METVAEIWRPIPDHIGYEASNLGRIRSLERVIPYERNGKTYFRKWKGRILRPAMNRGYLVTGLGSDLFVRGVHQWVAMAWYGPPPPGMVVNHINGIKTDNRPENLEYVTNSENVHHAYRTGLLSNQGTTNGNAKLTAEQVRDARRRYYTGESTIAELAAEYGLALTNMSGTVKGRRYKNVGA